MKSKIRSRKEVLGPIQKNIFYGISVLLWLTGVVWLYYRYGVEAQGEPGFQNHPTSSLVLQIHGAAAIGFCIILGSSLYHIRPGWKKKIQRFSGALLLSVCVLLILTGWGLYYLGDEQFRNITSVTHSFLGLILPVLVFVHVWRIIQDRSKAANTEAFKKSFTSN
jgi:heme A synthase